MHGTNNNMVGEELQRLLLASLVLRLCDTSARSCHSQIHSPLIGLLLAADLRC